MTTLKLKCEYSNDNKASETVTYIEGTQLAGEKFEEKRKLEFNVNELPTHIVDLCANYGLRAILADRTSDAKKLGINKLDWMAETFSMLADGLWNKKRVAGGGIDRALIHLIVSLRECTAIEAEAALKQTTKEWRDAIGEKYTDELATIRADLASADSVDLTDL